VNISQNKSVLIKLTKRYSALLTAICFSRQFTQLLLQLLWKSSHCKTLHVMLADYQSYYWKFILPM